MTANAFNLINIRREIFYNKKIYFLNNGSELAATAATTAAPRPDPSVDNLISNLYNTKINDINPFIIILSISRLDEILK